MRKYIILIAITALSVTGLKAQKYLTKEGTIEIYSQTSLFTIQAENHKVGSILNSETGDVVASTLVRSFKFKEALVEEHFNENYMESHNFPKSQFKGKITNFGTVDLNKKGSYPITIEGELTMHGETRPETLKGTLKVDGDKIVANAEMIISLENYKIKVEESYKDRIKDDVQLKISFDYNKM